MAAPDKTFTVFADTAVDADSPLDTVLMTGLRDNDIHLEQWLGDSYTAAKDHNHDGVNSAIVSTPETGIDWANSNGLSQMSLGFDSYTSGAHTTSYVTQDAFYIYIPPSANSLEIRFENRSDTGHTNTLYCRFEIDGEGISDNAAIFGTTTTYQLRNLSLDISTISGNHSLQWRISADSATGNTQSIRRILLRFA